MKVSYKWMSEYVEDMPPVEAVVHALTMHSFEVENVEYQEKGDTLLDIKILPNRTHDCLSHYGIASEIASVCSLNRKPLIAREIKPTSEKKEKSKLKISIDSKLCARAVAVHITGLKIGESPEWLKDRLKSIGERPINSVVDITNYLMFAFGQPMHAFDASKIISDWRGNTTIDIRQAKKEEKVVLLNTKEYELDSSMIVLSNKDKVLDVAGVMGGQESKVTEETTDIVLTICNFNAVSIRKTSKLLGIRTGASQRYENEISPTLIDRVIPTALKLISEIAGGSVGVEVDEYLLKQKQTILTVAAENILNILGIEINAEKIIELLERQGILAIKIEQTIQVSVPYERLDLTLEEDIAEEVGRLFGYENITPTQLPLSMTQTINTTQYISNIIRSVLVKSGFSEIYTYAFVDFGEVEVENPLASDKKFLRKDLSTAMASSLEHNSKFLDVLGLKEIKLFEIGKIFRTQGEFLHLSLGVKYPKGAKSHMSDEEIVKAIRAIEAACNVSIGDISVVGGQAEIDLERILSEVVIPIESLTKYPADFWNMVTADVSYKPISPYPFAVRDVAVFVPSGVLVEKVTEFVKQHITDIVVRFSLFDTFVKVDKETGTSKTSYAFRLVFQSNEKTLTDEEINTIMNPIYETLKAQEGFEVR